jgi:uncharacterized protein
MEYKPPRIRDPIHNLIEFKADDFEDELWRVIQTRPFQRLRRIKQLGLSELVYPGAAHSRFAHSIGVFHTARKLMTVIERHLDKKFKVTKSRTALAAALVHDIGHGPFSHAFEEVGRRLDLKMARHEHVSDLLIRDSEVSNDLKKNLGSGFANDVADVISSDVPSNIYNAVVSSQFDADRLDYMQRDRLMTGTQHSAIDFEWLIANLEVGSIPYSVDNVSAGQIETLVLGPKAIYAAEAYVLGLFQLYPTVYFHKATRSAEIILTELLVQIISKTQDSSSVVTGLDPRHPLIKFAQEPDNIEYFLQLDDAVIWGSLPMMAESSDPLITDFAIRLRDRKLLKCIDIRDQFIRGQGKDEEKDEEKEKEKEKEKGKDSAVDKACARVNERVKQWNHDKNDRVPRIFVDQANRVPYKRFEESKGPLNQIRIKTTNGDLVDLGERSKVVAAIEPFKLFRIYYSESDTEAKSFIEQEVEKEISNVAGGKKKAKRSKAGRG